jgi:hypothetical protein
MTLELGELNFIDCFEESELDDWLNPRYDSLPINNTQKIISHMPEDRWEIPQEPFSTSRFRIDEDDSDFTKKRRRELFQKDCRETIAEWVPFLDKAEKGHQMAKRASEEGIISGGLDKILAFNTFTTTFITEAEATKEGWQELIVSCRNAFLKLLPDEEVKRLGHEKPKRLRKKDIENVKILVNNYPENEFQSMPDF